MNTTTETPEVDDVTAQEPLDATEETVEHEDTPEAPEAAQEPQGDPETFPRPYVEKLRAEAAEYRTKAKAAETLARRLHTALVAADGRLVAPEELAFDPSHLDDPKALTAAVDDLLARKPYLAARKIRGDIGQGEARSGETVDLAGILRARA